MTAVIFDIVFFFFQAEDGIRDYKVTGVQTCALPILFLCSPPKTVLAWRPDSRATSMKLTPRSLDAAADLKAPRAEKDAKPRPLGRANARVLCNGNAIADRLNDLSKARRWQAKTNGTFPTFA